MNNKPEKYYALNRKANFEYHILETYESGLMLFGSEVKSIAASRCSINDAYIIERNGELFIQNFHVAENQQTGSYFQHDPLRLRKLLLHRRQIDTIIGKINEDGCTAIVLNLHANNNKIKALIAVAKGKNAVNKKNAIIEREAKREMSRARRGDY